MYKHTVNNYQQDVKYEVILIIYMQYFSIYNIICFNSIYIYIESLKSQI